jgi:hypothetical protein
MRAALRGFFGAAGFDAPDFDPDFVPDVVPDGAPDVVPVADAAAVARDAGFPASVLFWAACLSFPSFSAAFSRVEGEDFLSSLSVTIDWYPW